jgi:hypothetical protein
MKAVVDRSFVLDLKDPLMSAIHQSIAESKLNR